VDANFLFIGGNQLGHCKNRACLWDLIPSELRPRFVFRDAIGKREMCAEGAGRARVALFASYYETYCLALHEVRPERIDRPYSTCT
jgi:hypothetical protein